MASVLVCLLQAISKYRAAKEKLIKNKRFIKMINEFLKEMVQKKGPIFGALTFICTEFRNTLLPYGCCRTETLHPSFHCE